MGKPIMDRKILGFTIMNKIMLNGGKLSAECFDFDVDLTKTDIVVAYADLQKSVNNHTVLVNPAWLQRKGVEKYVGNCKEFLLSLNDSDDFARISDNGLIDFAF